MTHFIRALAYLTAALIIAGCSPQQQRQAQNTAAQTGTQVRNGALEARVSAAIAAEAGENAFHITPVARGGVVTLTGTVPTRDIAQTVLATTRQVPGVTKVVDRVTIK